MSIVPPTSTSNEPEFVWELATMYPPQGAWSEEEYLSLTDSTNRLIEFTGGRLEFLAKPTRVHQRIVKYVFLLLTAYVEKHKLGEVLPGGMRVNTSEGNYRIPDVIYLSAEHEDKWGGERFFYGVDLAIEIVSDDDQSQHRDYDLKVVTYAEAGIPEYWIVDPKEEKITVLTLPDGASAYAEHGVFKPGESATSKLLDGFSVDVQAVFDAAKG